MAQGGKTRNEFLEKFSIKLIRDDDILINKFIHESRHRESIPQYCILNFVVT